MHAREIRSKSNNEDGGTGIKQLYYSLYACMGDNPRGLSPEHARKLWYNCLYRTGDKNRDVAIT